MRFFFDRNISHHLARMLAGYAGRYDDEVRAHDDDPRFELNTPDEVWLKALGQDDPPWVVVCGDGAILNNPAERAALEEANLTFVCFAPSWIKMRFDDQAWRLIKEWNKIAAKVRSAGDRPRIYKVHWGRSVKIDDLGETRRRGRHGPR
jgi:PIN like domain